MNSQYISTHLTHLTSQDGYDGMRENGIKITDHGNDALLYKSPAFWISVDYGWEQWCTWENFRDVQKEIICNVFLKPNLLFIKIQTVDDANELFNFLLPELVNHRMPDDFFPLSDLITLSRYQIHELHKGKLVTPKDVWSKAMKISDGIYFENSGDLHMHTIFNTWDCSSIMLFDPRNVASINKIEADETPTITD